MLDKASIIAARSVFTSAAWTEVLGVYSHSDTARPSAHSCEEVRRCRGLRATRFSPRPPVYSSSAFPQVIPNSLESSASSRSGAVTDAYGTIRRRKRHLTNVSTELAEGVKDACGVAALTMPSFHQALRRHGNRSQHTNRCHHCEVVQACQQRCLLHDHLRELSQCQRVCVGSGTV